MQDFISVLRLATSLFHQPRPDRPASTRQIDAFQNFAKWSMEIKMVDGTEGSLEKFDQICAKRNLAKRDQQPLSNVTNTLSCLVSDKYLIDDEILFKETQNDEIQGIPQPQKT